MDFCCGSWAGDDSVEDGVWGEEYEEVEEDSGLDGSSSGTGVLRR